MTEIIENGESGAASIPLLSMGESSSGVSLKLYQDIYHQVTGRTERISRRYKDNLLLDLGDIVQLHHKISQLCDVHHIVASNEVVSIFYEKERKEQFTSFERFKLHNANATSPCLNVVLKFNFSLTPSGLKKPQEYVVTVKLTSRLGVMKQLEEDDSPSFMRGFFFSRSPTAEITVDYADYVIARGFMEAFEEWIKGTKRTADNTILKFVRTRSHYIPELFKVIGAVGLVVLALSNVATLTAVGILLSVWARFFVIYAGCSYIIISLLGLAGSWLEQAIDNYPTLSYVNLNKGDENLIADFQQQLKPVMWRFASGCFLAIILGIISTKLEKLI